MEPMKKVTFTKEMKQTHTILIPTMLPIHFKILGNVLENYGYKIKVLDNFGQGVIDQGLKNVHNDTCYPAQLVIGQMIDALEHCDLPLDKVALLITQTGGGCRASNYIHLLRKALNKCGYGEIPVISASFLKSEQSGGFSLPVTMLLQAVYGVLCGDLIMTLYNQCIPYENVSGESQKAVDDSVEMAEQLFCKKLLRWKEVSALMVKIIKRFNQVNRRKEEKIKVGIVGEIYVKYSPLGNNNLEEFLLSEGCEVVCPGLFDFLLYCTHNVEFDHDLYGINAVKAAVMRKVNYFLRGRKSDIIHLIEQNSDFQPPCHFESTIESTKGYIGKGVKMGEGWLLTAEMVELIQHYHVNNIVCTQPFGCLPNHICGMGVMRVIKEKNPQANIVAVDYDSSASKVNQQNRIKLMLANARLMASQQNMASGNTSNRQQDSTLKQVQDVNEDSHSQVHAGFAASTVGNKSSEEQLELAVQNG